MVHLGKNADGVHDPRTAGSLKPGKYKETAHAETKKTNARRNSFFPEILTDAQTNFS